MRVGLLDRRITIERKVAAADPEFNSELITWVTHAEVWADVRDQHAVERVGGELRTVTHVVMVTTRWVDSVTTDMRIRLNSDNRLLQIVSIAEMRKRTGLNMKCEQYSA